MGAYQIHWCVFSWSLCLHTNASRVYTCTSVYTNMDFPGHYTWVAWHNLPIYRSLHCICLDKFHHFSTSIPNFLQCSLHAFCPSVACVHVHVCIYLCHTHTYRVLEITREGGNGGLGASPQTIWCFSIFQHVHVHVG